MLNLCLPMKVINITQHSGGSYSHPNYSLDLAGSDSGIDFAFALGDFWRCISGPWGSNTYFFTPCDETGHAVEIHCADGIDRKVTVAMTHADFDKNKYVPKPIIGKIYKNGESMYQEGTYGKATGNHIHYEVAAGLQYGKSYDSSMGVYRMPNELKPEDVCFICDSFSTVRNMGGVVMKHCDTPYYNALEKLPEGLNGIDISNWQKTIDLSKVYADFVIIKFSEGVDWTDPSFSSLYAQAKKAGKRLGAYHFARPTKNNDAIREADTFIAALRSVDAIGHALLALDWEAENMWNVKYAKTFLDRVYNVTGVKPLIYMSESVVRSYDWTSVANAGYGLWVAKYRDKIIDKNYDMTMCGSIPIIKSWSDYEMWQWTSVGRLDNYNGDLDCNIFYGGYTEWDAWATNTDPLAAYTDEELARRVLEGIYGNGDRRKAALGDRYAAVQIIVNKMANGEWDDEPEPEPIPIQEPVPTPIPEPEPEPSIEIEPVSNETFEYKGLTIHVGKISKRRDIRGSVDGNKFGKPYDKTVPAGFSDKDLLNAGYSEATAQNGSTFYSWNGATYAEGLEVSMGQNNQELYMDAVSKFNNTLAVGFPYSGGIEFAPQRELASRIQSYYGAVTGIFGIIYGGQRNAMGAEINRNNGYNVRSGRSILAEDDYYYYSICFAGNTGNTGLTGAELYDLCIKVSPIMFNAICFDGGGSVFQRVNGNYNINTTRQVKNGVMLFVKNEKEEEKEKPEEPVVNPLDKYTDEELADMVLAGKFGSGEERKIALGDRYIAVQTIVNIRVLNKNLKKGDKIRIKLNAKDLNVGTTYINAVYTNTYIVKEVSDNRVVFGTDNTIIGVVSMDNIIVVY